jgi:hypothetical protein
MSRYANTLKTTLSVEQANGIITGYLEAEGFKRIEERGEMVWRKGFGALVNPQFIKADVAADGTVHIEVWTAGVSLVPGVYGGELDPMHGVFGAGPKMALRPRVRELESRLGGVPNTSAAAAQSPAGWFPDPTGRHEHRYWDGAQWTEHVSDSGQSGVDPMGTS